MKHISVRDLALFSLLGATVFAAKMAMAALPNIEPVSLLVMLLAVCFGWRGLYAVALYVALEFCVWGFGLWSLCYLYAWPLLFCLARLFRRMESPVGWAVLSGCFGLLFGALGAIVYWITGGWAAAVSWWVAGIPMDLIHGASNFFIALVLFRPLRRCLKQLQSWWDRHENP